MINYITHTHTYIYINFFNKTTLKVYYTSNFISKSFFLHFYKFLLNLGPSIFYVKISADISPI